MELQAKHYKFCCVCYEFLGSLIDSRSLCYLSNLSWYYYNSDDDDDHDDDDGEEYHPQTDSMISASVISHIKYVMQQLSSTRSLFSKETRGR